MLGFGGSVRIYYCPTPVNLRKSFDGIAGAVEEYIKQDSESGYVFAFFIRDMCSTLVDCGPGNERSEKYRRVKLKVRMNLCTHRVLRPPLPMIATSQSFICSVLQ